MLARDFHQRHYEASEKDMWGHIAGMAKSLAKRLRGKYDVIIVDSYEAATMGDSLDPQQAARNMLFFTQLASESNCAVIVVDHSPKGVRDTVYGSAKKTDFARVVIGIDYASSDEAGQLKLTSRKCNVAARPTFPMVDRVETEDTLRFATARTVTFHFGADENANAAALERHIDDALRAGAKTNIEVQQHVQLALDLSSVEAARKRIDRAGLADRLPGTRRAHTAAN